MTQDPELHLYNIYQTACKVLNLAPPRAAMAVKWCFQIDASVLKLHLLCYYFCTYASVYLKELLTCYKTASVEPT